MIDNLSVSTYLHGRSDLDKKLKFDYIKKGEIIHFDIEVSDKDLLYIYFQLEKKLVQY